MVYVVCFALILAANTLPGFVPPTWTIVSFFVIQYDLSIPPTVACGVAAATLGRWILSCYVRFISDRVLNERARDNLAFIGNRLTNRPAFATFLFVFLYSLTPLPTTALFVAAGIAHVRKVWVLTGFAAGRIVSYSVLAYTAHWIANRAHLWTNLTWQGLLSSALGAILVFLFIFLDWRALLENRSIRLNFRIFRRSQ